MFTLLSHTEEIFRMDCRVLASIRGVESLPLLPTTVKSFATGGRALLVFGYLPSNCQHGLGQRRRQGSKVHILYQPGISLCKRKVSTHGKARLHFSYGSLQAQAILLSLHGNRPNHKPLHRAMSNLETAGRLAL